jgi:hypothetical protein
MDTPAPISDRNLYGVMAAFATPGELLRAADAARVAGYKRIDGFSPFPIEGLSEALGMRRTRLPWVVFCFGILGACCGYGLQYYCAVIAYPLNIGGRPLHSWPAFIPVTFELTVLFAAGAAVLGMLASNGMPMPYHPVFNVPSFSFASRDRFFLCIESRDRIFDRAKALEFLRGLSPLEVSEVPR